jgi:succinate dehydrogenase / fumarate reductase cytochrome b subunit
MLITGLVIAGFLVIHLLDFRIAKIGKDEYSMAAMVRERLSSGLGAGVYMVAMLALCLHLRHAFQSALQTLGLNHPRWTPLVQKISIALALFLALGFASIPMYFLARAGQ